METLRLRRIQEPSQVERLLDGFISRSVSLPSGAYAVRDTWELPNTLRGIVAQAAARGETWLCFSRGSQVWLFICEMSLALSRERGVPVLLVRQYDEDARVKDSGTWRCDPLGTWTRCID